MSTLGLTRRDMMKIGLFYALLSLSVPLALAFSDIVTGLASPSEFADALLPVPLVYLATTALVGGLVFSMLLRRLSLNGRSWIVTTIRYGSLLWGSTNNLVFSLVLHANSDFGQSAAAQTVAGMYAWAVGLFFGILMVVGISSEIEKLVPMERYVSSDARGGLTSKLVLSVTVVVAAFLAGAIGVTLMTVVAGFDPLSALSRIAVIAVPFLLLTLVLVFFLSRIMTTPLVRSVSTIEALGERDLSQSFDVGSRDEIGRLFFTLNRFVGELRGVIRAAAGNSAANRDKSEALDSLVAREKELLASITNEMQQINASIAAVNENARATVTETKGMGSAAGRLIESVQAQTESVSETSAAAEQMLAIVQNIASVANTRREAAGSLEQVTATSQNNLTTALETMEQVTTQLTTLSDINKVINSVAAQTNLLAMNAAIEAAHAGDAGRGFSVVADEIRKLAESTSSNSKESSTFLKGMIGSIEQSNRSLGLMNASFAEVESVSREVVAGLTEIAEASAEMEQSANVIVSRMNRLSEHNATVAQGSGRIRDGVSAVNDVSTRSSSSAARSQEEADKILEHVQSLADLASSIGDNSRDLKDSAEELSKRFSEFRLG